MLQNSASKSALKSPFIRQRHAKITIMIYKTASDSFPLTGPLMTQSGFFHQSDILRLSLALPLTDVGPWSTDIMEIFDNI
jgi:hypothetical protein